MTNIPINWQTYLDVFPDRYIQPGVFDRLVESFLNKSLDVLDVGGGVKGTLVLKGNKGKTWLADPFVDGSPDWMFGNYGSVLSIPDTFDLIVARGSFNYLTQKEIDAIACLMRQDAVFIFNTFIVPSTGERFYRNSSSQTCGIERYFNRTDHVVHQLIPEQGPTIEHSFYVYSKNWIENIFQKNNRTVSFVTNNNSLHVIVQRN